MSRGLLAVRGFLALAALILAPAADARTASRPPGEGRALVMRLEGPVSPVMAEALGRAIDRAEHEGYEALVIEVDTPGGLESSMRTMVKRLLASPVPVVAWVCPGGAHAASAGVFVVMAADVAAMAPGTHIGAATPINLQGPMDSTLARKATSDAAAFARTVAAQRGRNAAWAEQAVRQAVSASETEAVRLGIVDFGAATLAELLALADGREWKRGATTRTLALAGVPHDRIEPDFRQRVLAVLGEPNVAYILLMLGFYGLLFELQNPGSILPGVVGGICLILAFFALSALSVNYAGVALLVLGLVFFIAESQVTSHGMLAAGGVLAVLLGSLLLFRAETAPVSLGLVLGATLATTVFFLFIVGAGLRAQKRRVRTGAEGMIGAHGEVVVRIAPEGWVRIGDERWSARAETEVELGTRVEVVGIERLTLHVRPIAKEA